MMRDRKPQRRAAEIFTEAFEIIAARTEEALDDLNKLKSDNYERAASIDRLIAEYVRDASSRLTTIASSMIEDAHDDADGEPVILQFQRFAEENGKPPSPAA